MLHFSRGNAKISNDTVIFNLPAGWTCPGADQCLSKADRSSGRITDGPNVQFRCYAASMEATYKTTRDSRWRNFEALAKLRGSSEDMALLILQHMPKSDFCRIHESGDFFSQSYFDAWLMVAKQRPDTTFYAYTKSLKVWLKRQDSIPRNFGLVASYGGKFDHLIAKHNLRHSLVVPSALVAEQLGLPVDRDESLARDPQAPSFALVLHGTQPAGSDASESIRNLKEYGEKFAYTRS